MARVPTWTELRMDATKLNQLQRECYYSVHKLLDLDIPELDRKISSLSSNSSNGHMQAPAENPAKSPDVVPPPISRNGTHVAHVNNSVINDTWKPESVQIRNSKSLESVQAKNFKYPEVTLIRNHKNSEIIPNKLNGRTKFVPIRETVVSPDVFPVTKVQESRKVTIRNVVTQDHAPVKVKESQRRVPTRNKRLPGVIHHEEPNFDELEHLRPLPLPLTYYFQKNRHGLVMRIDSRIMYLRNKSERRKQLASTRIINSLKQIRLSSRNSTNNLMEQQARQQDFMRQKYQVQPILSEHEMRTRTARTYKRLPEVKRRRREEFSNHMKVQNYKNKLEYGRKLLENRRQGIINYPLRSSCDDRSITSSQSDFF